MDKASVTCVLLKLTKSISNINKLYSDKLEQNNIRKINYLFKIIIISIYFKSIYIYILNTYIYYK